MSQNVAELAHIISWGHEMFQNPKMTIYVNGIKYDSAMRLGLSGAVTSGFENYHPCVL